VTHAVSQTGDDSIFAAAGEGGGECRLVSEKKRVKVRVVEV